MQAISQTVNSIGCRAKSDYGVDMSNGSLIVMTVLAALHSKNNKYFRAPFLVLQLVSNGGLVSVPGRTNQYLEGPQYQYWGPGGLVGPSRYRQEFPFCD